MINAPQVSPELPATIVNRWDPEYRDFILSLPQEALIPPHQIGWSQDLRQAINSSTAGKAEPVPVGSTLNFDLEGFSVLCFTPDGEAPPCGWPVLVYAHGGGLLFGSAKSEISFTTRICTDVKCVVISVDYRLAPEYTFPYAYNDVWETLSWVRGEGAEKLNLDRSHIALGGYSSGATLAAAIAQQASLCEPPIRLVGQLLLMPSLDVTPSYDPNTWSSSMGEYAEVPGLWTRDVLWARDMHTPSEGDRADPKASPLTQKRKGAFKNMPPTWIGVAEMDPLRSDGETYARALKGQDVQVELKAYDGASHLTVVADGVCALARRMQNDQITFLKVAFSRI
ncbi:alpha/beta hydrolase fold-domain-containing protein [Rhizoctonia solani]|nr:alpha/beta hydrolase fold-domain-containing protein [Rhizoctonia solani]